MRRIAATAALLALGLALPGCALWPGPDRPARAAALMPGALEPIHAAAFTHDLAVFRVSSNGCTDRDDITPVVTRAGGREPIITLRRIDEDDCKQRDDDGVELAWSFKELGLDPGEMVEVNNPYLLTPTPPSSPRR